MDYEWLCCISQYMYYTVLREALYIFTIIFFYVRYCLSVFQQKHVVFLISFFQFHWNSLTPQNVVAEFVYCSLYSTCSTNRNWQLLVVLLCRNQIQTNPSSVGTLGLSTPVFVGISQSLKTWHSILFLVYFGGTAYSVQTTE